MVTKSCLLHQGLEINAKRTPRKVAVEYQEQKVTYAQLNTMADCLSAHLLECGLNKEDLILIMADKSVKTVSALFAILKTGGAYVPLDPETPDNRLQLIVSKSLPKCIITESKYASKFKDYAKGNHIILLDKFLFHDFYEKTSRKKVADSDLAYIIFTSGTTGQPKGVML